MVEKGKSAFAGPEIRGKKLGVIGLGAIGVLVANAANDLGMTVYGYDPFLSLQNAWNLSHNIIRATEMKEIFEKCDYITLHIPLTKDTKGTINKDALDKMKDGVRILNFARDGLVDSDAMLEALSSGKVATYVVDFPTDEMLCVENVIAIPHLGASTPESEDNCAVMAAKELIEYIEDGNITNSVNFPNISMPRSGDIRFCVIHKNIPNMPMDASAFSSALCSFAPAMADSFRRFSPLGVSPSSRQYASASRLSSIQRVRSGFFALFFAPRSDTRSTTGTAPPSRNS